GAIICQTNRQYTTELRGIGKEMPITLWTFTIGSLALIGIPPLSGFISKWYLGIGGLGFENYTIGVIGVVTLIVSALLTGGYLIPIFVDGFFPGRNYEYNKLTNLEPTTFMTVPLIILAAATVLFGMFPSFLINFFEGIAGSII